MEAPRDPREPRPRRSPVLHELLRWLVAIPIAAVVAGALFVAMAALVDGSWLVERLIRVFPLREKTLTPEERCELATLRSAPAVTIEGTVGTRIDGHFVPLADAEVRGEGGIAAGGDVEVGADGRFRLATALPVDAPPECPQAATPTPQLVVGAPGCILRRVPVTPAWVPHRIVLSCPRRDAVSGPAG